MPQSINPNKLLHLSTLLFAFFVGISKPAATIAEVLAAVGWLWALYLAPAAVWRTSVIHNKILHYCAAIFALYLVGIVYSADTTQALSELNGKHYFITLPLFLGIDTLAASKYKQNIIFAFILGNAVAAVAIIFTHFSDILWLGAKPDIPSPFVQRPRASMFLAFGLMGILHHFFIDNPTKITGKTPQKVAIFLFILLLFALIILKGRIGQLSFLLMLMLWLFFYVKHRLNYIKTAFFLCLFIVFVSFTAIQIPSIRQPFAQAIQELKQAQQGFSGIKIRDSSMGMRVVYYQVYAQIMSKNPILGVGTGDMQRVATPYFGSKSSYYLPYDKPHNQFIETIILFGVVGLVVFLFILMRLMRHIDAQSRALAWCFWVLILLSMCLDSTLGTQAGCSFFVLFAVVFSSNPTKKNDDITP
jgi:O-antigen ligase